MEDITYENSNVGIGNPTTPTKLDIHGTVKMSKFTKLFIKFCTWYFNRKGFTFTVTSPEQEHEIFYLYTNGNVGIGK